MTGPATKEAPVVSEEASAQEQHILQGQVASGASAVATQGAYYSWLLDMYAHFDGNLGALQNGNRNVIDSLNDDILHAHAFERHFRAEITDPETRKKVSNILNQMSTRFRQVCKDQHIEVEEVDISHLDQVSDHVRNIFNWAQGPEHFRSLTPEQHDFLLQPLSDALSKAQVTTDEGKRRFMERLFELKGYLRDGTFARDAAEGTGFVSDSLPQAASQSKAIEEEVKNAADTAKNATISREKAEAYATEARLRKKLYETVEAGGETAIILRLAREDAERAYDKAIAEYKSLQANLSKQEITEDKLRSLAVVAVALDTLNAEKKSMQTA